MPRKLKAEAKRSVQIAGYATPVEAEVICKAVALKGLGKAQFITETVLKAAEEVIRDSARQERAA